MASITYSPKEVILTISGTRVEGWDRISVIPEAPNFKIVKGIRGVNTRVRSKSTACAVEVEILAGNPIGNAFEQLVDLDIASGTARLSIQIKDNLGHEVFYSSEGFLEAPARRDYALEASTRVYTFRCLSRSMSDSGDGLSLMSLVNKVSSIFS